MHAFVRFALAALVMAVFVHTRADPDLWGNVRFGHDIVSARGVHIADTYSFASDRPWTNHEWLAEVVIYGAYALAGGLGLIALKVILLLAVAAAAIATMRAGAIPANVHDLLIAVLLLGSVPQAIHVRPQLFSLALFAWLLAALVGIARGRARWALAIPPMMMAWASLHGGWIVGAGTLVVWVAAGIIARISPRERLTTTVVAGISIVATLVNPYGWELWGFLRQTVGFGRVDIADWQPIYRIGMPYLLLWVLVAAAGLSGVWAAVRARSLDPRVFAIVAMFAVASFRVNRLLAFFAIAVVLLLHEPIAAAWRERHRVDTLHPHPAVRAAFGLVIGSVILIGSVATAVRHASCVQIDTVGYPDPEVAGVVGSQKLHGRMLTWFGWGHYAIWHFAPAISISMDGRRETIYSDAEIRQHLQFYFVPEARQRILDALKPDYIWLPADLPVVERLRDDGWRPVFSGHQSVLLAQTGAFKPADQPGHVGPRCFPGP